MVVLNVSGKIEPICISDKLKLYISNLPNEEENNWNKELVNENTERYIEELDALDHWVHEKVSELPVEQRILVTPHDAFA